MASTPVRRARFKVLDGLGIDRVIELYVDEVGTVRGLCQSLFKPHTKGTPGVTEFYAWLKERGYQEEWREAKRLKGSVAADTAVDLAMAADESTVRSAKLKVDTLRWQASKLAPSEFGDRQTLEVEAGQTIGSLWLAALRAIEQNEDDDGPENIEESTRTTRLLPP